MNHTPVAPRGDIARHVGELWTSSQRRASAIHEISYRACFKPQVPRFFIERFTKEGDVVYDPFMGRGTTVLEAVLLGRKAIGNDVNPLSLILVEPRLVIPTFAEVCERLDPIQTDRSLKAGMDLSMFYHEGTLSELLSLRRFLQLRKESGKEDHVDRWIRMVATNRLTGHSPGFFSVYTLPPNQATTPTSQRRINKARGQRPPYRNVRKLILRKTERILRAITPLERRRLAQGAEKVTLLNTDARGTSRIDGESVQLTVTSPPFLDIVDYATDNWLRCWFNGIDGSEIGKAITKSRSLDDWMNVMSGVFEELYRVTKRGGHVAFEVGEIRRKTIELEHSVIPIGGKAGFFVQTVYINQQQFTKTSNIWGIRNNVGGTNTNRIVLFQKR